MCESNEHECALSKVDALRHDVDLRQNQQGVRQFSENVAEVIDIQVIHEGIEQ